MCKEWTQKVEQGLQEVGSEKGWRRYMKCRRGGHRDGFGRGKWIQIKNKGKKTMVALERGVSISHQLYPCPEPASS